MKIPGRSPSKRDKIEPRFSEQKMPEQISKEETRGSGTGGYEPTSVPWSQYRSTKLEMSDSC